MRVVIEAQVLFQDAAAYSSFKLFAFRDTGSDGDKDDLGDGAEGARTAQQHCEGCLRCRGLVEVIAHRVNARIIEHRWWQQGHMCGNLLCLRDRKSTRLNSS